MRLTFRPAVLTDFDGMFRACFPHNLDDVPTRSAVAHEWRVFLGNPATLSMVVEHLDRPESDRLVGFAQTLFVSDALVRRLRSGVCPYANQHASRPLPGGAWPLLSPHELRKANRAEGVNALVTHWAWRENGVTPGDQRIIREYVDEAYGLFYRGYRFKEVLISAGEEWACQSLIHAGFGMVDDYEAWFREHPPLPPPERRPYLLGLTRAEALANEGSHASRIFAYCTPRLRLGPAHQELLFHALLGRTDEEISLLADISLAAVRKRWGAVFPRIGKAIPSLLPGIGGEPGGPDRRRGPEKRRAVLEYVREHLEELRPTLLRPR